MEQKSKWFSYTEEELNELNHINEVYKECLNKGKTERECVQLIVHMAKEHGYENIDDVLLQGKQLNREIKFMR